MQINFANYYPGNSWLHRLDPRVKLIFSAVWMIIIFAISKWTNILFYGLFLLAIAISSKISLKKLLLCIKPLFFVMALAFLLNILVAPGKPIFSFLFISISQEGLILAIRLCLRISYLVLSTSLLLTLVTTPLAIADALEKIFSPLARLGFPSHELSMMVSIALRFVPTLLEEADKLMKAQSSRGANFDSGSIFNRTKGLVTVLVPLFVSSLKRAEDLALAMEARCYNGGENRTKIRSLHYTKMDYLTYLVFSLIALFFILTEGGVLSIG